MKCYHVQNKNGEYQQLVFAEKRSDAIVNSEAYEWDGEYINVQATRKPEYDKYKEQGYVPKQALLNDGWWFECYGRDPNGKRCCKQLTDEDNPLVIDERVYCGKQCMNTAGEG